VRRLVVISLLACGLLVTAAAVAGPPRIERMRLRPADMALAKSITLRASDLSAGWTRQRPSTRPQELPRCPGADLDFSPFTITGKAGSSFSRGTSAVESFVEVFKSRADASGDFRKSTQPKLLACLGPELRRQARKTGIDVRLESARFAGKRAIGDRGFEYRVVTSVATGTGARIRIYVDLIGFQRGRTLVGIYFSGTSPVAGRLAVAKSLAARAG
jgi:hypothetical protein